MNTNSTQHSIKDEKEVRTRKFVISTLGPEGTCSEYASLFYINLQQCEGCVELYPTFEESVIALKNEQSDCSIIPSAYKRLADIIFQEQRYIEIADVFRLSTPNLVLADRGGCTQNADAYKKVATHSSPSSLVKEQFPSATLVIANSNSEAAKMLVAKEVDACITTIMCVEKHSLSVIRDFGGISMGWNVLKRKQYDLRTR